MTACYLPQTAAESSTGMTTFISLTREFVTSVSHMTLGIAVFLHRFRQQIEAGDVNTWVLVGELPVGHVQQHGSAGTCHCFLSEGPAAHINSSKAAALQNPATPPPSASLNLPCR